MNNRTRFVVYSLLWLFVLVFFLLAVWLTSEGSVSLAFLFSSASTALLVWQDWSEWRKGFNQEHYPHTGISDSSGTRGRLDRHPTWSEFWSSGWSSGISLQELPETIGPFKARAIPSLLMMSGLCYLIGLTLNFSFLQIVLLGSVLSTIVYFFV